MVASYFANFSSLSGKKLLSLKVLLFTILPIIFLSLHGCGLVTLTTTKIEASINRDRINTLKIGMSEKEVINVVGMPYKSEATIFKEKKYSILYYLTEGRGAFRSLDDWNFTPVIFENDLFVGWGKETKDAVFKKD
jgi:outer membrane protein assembly factor BamE (lipoprotein component of BamABCDE complex)